MSDADSLERAVLDRLSTLGIAYQRYEHPPVPTVEEAVQHWAGIDAAHCKNLFLRNQKGNRHYLVIIAHTKRADLRAVANQIGDPEAVVGRLGVMIRVAMVDVGTWILPLVALAVVARHVGIGGRFVAYVVASNWASAIVAWMLLPSALARLFEPAPNQFTDLLTLFLFLLAMFLTWRMTNAVIGKGAAVGSAVFAGMVVASLIVLFSLQAMLGIGVPA